VQSIVRWDPPWWLKVAVGIAAFVVGSRWPIAVPIIIALAIPLIIVGVREKQRRKREGPRALTSA
jgi:hypothetical protein